MTDFSPESQPDGEASAERESRLVEIAKRGDSCNFSWILRGMNGGERRLLVAQIPAELLGQSTIITMWSDATEPERRSDELHESEPRYKRLVEGIQRDFLLYATDLEGKLIYVSPSAQQVLGYAPSEVLGHNWREFVKPGTSTLAAAEANELACVEGRYPEPVVIELRHLEGTPRMLEVHPRPVSNSAGAVVGVEGVARDVTLLKQAQATLQQANEDLERRVQERTAELASHSRLEALVLSVSNRFINAPVEQTDEMIVHALGEIANELAAERASFVVLSDDGSMGRITHRWNAAGVQFPEVTTYKTSGLAWILERLSRTSGVEMHRASELPEEACKLAIEYQKGGVKSLVYAPVFSGGNLAAVVVFSRTSSDELWPYGSIVLLRVAGETLYSAIQRSDATKALRASDERLRRTLDAVAEGSYDWDIPSGEVYVSDDWMVTLRYAPGPNLRLLAELQPLVHPDDYPAAQTAANDHLEGRTPIYEAEYRIRCGDGEWRWVSDRGRVVERDDQGRPLRLVGVLRDVTEQVLAQQRLKDLDAQVVHLGRVATMGEAVAGLAHEVNQPLHAAATFAAAARRSLAVTATDTAKAEQLMGRVSEQVSRAGDIIRQLREFTKPRPSELVSIDLNALIRQAAEFVSYFGRRRGVRTEFDFDESAPDIFGDRIQLQQVIVNLLQNAYEATAGASRNPVVVLTTRVTESKARVEVKDNGGGFPESLEPGRLFEAFFTTKPEGMGLGLALCRTIVESHHGRIWAESNADLGASFVVELPIRAGAIQ